MVRINKINGTNQNGYGLELTTKRDYRDGSELLITSKLSALYNRAAADYLANKKLSNIRQYISETPRKKNFLA